MSAVNLYRKSSLLLLISKRIPSPSEPTVPRGVRVASEWSWRLLTIAALAAVVIWLAAVFHDVVIALLVAVLLTALLSPIVNALVAKRWPRWLAVVVGLVTLVVAIAGLVFLVVWQVRLGLPQLQHESASAYFRVRASLRQAPWNISDTQFAGYLSNAAALIQKDSGTLIGGALRVGDTATHIVAGAAIALFATIFMLIDGRGIWRWIVGVFPKTAAPGLINAGNAGWTTLTSFTRAQILVAIVNAVGIGLVAFLLGLPLAIPIAVIVLLASFIPVVGAVASGILAVAIALIFAGPVQALIMLGGVLLVHLLENHVL